MSKHTYTEERYVQITSGRGPAECCWVVAQVLKVLIENLKKSGGKYEVIERSSGIENGTLQSALLKVTGKETMKLVRSWEGTIQWIGRSQYRKHHKRKNWFVGVSLIAPAETLKLNPSDVDFKAFRASGPGGQHRNKVETAIRATHKPTGISAEATDSKSQMQNKKSALVKLELKLKQKSLELEKQRIDQQWNDHLNLQRGNPVKVFEGRDFKERC